MSESGQKRRFRMSAMLSAILDTGHRHGQQNGKRGLAIFTFKGNSHDSVDVLISEASYAALRTSLRRSAEASATMRAT